MKAVLFRTGSGSIPVQTPPVPSSTRHKVFPTVHNSIANVFADNKNAVSSLHMEVARRKIRRCSSESGIANLGSRYFPSPPRIPEEEAGDWPASGISWDDLGFSGGGGGGGYGGNGGDRSKIGAYYREMLKSNPTNSLLLRNYGKYLHEVEKDVAKAEEYYGRAILANPGDGEVLSLYGKLIWESQRDELRAKSYFHQALHASPHDCFVLGMYAQFLWEAGEEEQEDQEMEKSGNQTVAALVEVF